MESTFRASILLLLLRYEIALTQPKIAYNLRCLSIVKYQMKGSLTALPKRLCSIKILPATFLQSIFQV